MITDKRTHTYKCGHKKTSLEYSYTHHGLTSLGVDSMMLAQMDCPDCRQTLAIERRHQEIQHMLNTDLATLKGTPKQVAWAISIMSRKAISIARLSVCLTRLRHDRTEMYLPITTEIMVIMRQISILYIMSDAVRIIDAREWDILADVQQTLTVKGMTLEGLS